MTLITYIITTYKCTFALQKSWHIHLQMVIYCHEFHQIALYMLHFIKCPIIRSKLFLEMCIHPFPLWYRYPIYSGYFPKAEHCVIILAIMVERHGSMNDWRRFLPLMEMFSDIKYHFLGYLHFITLMYTLHDGMCLCLLGLVLNPLRAKFFRGNINIYLHFMSLLHIDMTHVLKICPHVRPGHTYST